MLPFSTDKRDRWGAILPEKEEPQDAVDPWADSDPRMMAGGFSPEPSTADRITPAAPVLGPAPAPAPAWDPPSAPTLDPVPGPVPAPARNTRRTAGLLVGGSVLAAALVIGVSLLWPRSPGTPTATASVVAAPAPSGAAVSLRSVPPSPRKSKPVTTRATARPSRSTVPATTPAAAKPSPVATTPAAPPVAAAVEIVAVQTRKCVTAGASGKQLVISTCDGSAGQQWRAGTGGTLRAGDLCMNARSSKDLAAVDTVACTGAATQVFTFNGDDNLVNKASGKCLDIYDGQDADGSPLILWPCAGHGNQLWYRR